jgi:hypothetical protein
VVANGNREFVLAGELLAKLAKLAKKKNRLSGI